MRAQWQSFSREKEMSWKRGVLVKPKVNFSACIIKETSVIW
jgi:hypothetical protein